MAADAAAAARAFLLAHSPGPTLPVPSAVLVARAALRAALADLVAVPDVALAGRWKWRGGAVGMRFGFYWCYDLLEAAHITVERILRETDYRPAAAAPIVAAATAARWDLHGLLAGLSEADLGRDPGGGEWTIRRTLAHVVGGQRAYGVAAAWWLSRRDAPEDDFPLRPPEEVTAAMALPEETAEGEGSLAEIQARIDAVLDLDAGRLGGLGAADLAVRARWATHAVTTGFRLARWAAHLREHTIQVEKTLVFIDRPPREAERLVRLVAATYGHLEALVFAAPEAVLAVAGPGGETAGDALMSALAEVRFHAELIRGAAG